MQFLCAYGATTSSVIGVWTPSCPAAALFPRRLERATSALEEAGFTVTFAAHARSSDRLVAAPPVELARDLHDLLLDPAVEVVMCASGGYTSLAALPYIDWELVREARKPIVGYSDITSVLWAALARATLVTFYGPMLISEFGEFGGPWPFTLAHFGNVLDPCAGPTVLEAPAEWTDEFLLWEVEDVRRRTAHPAEWRSLAGGSADGWLLPGCGPTASRLFGTPYMPATAGAILCLEGPSLAPDDLLGLLSQWEASGRISDLAGVVIGRHSQPRAAAAGSDNFDEVVRRVFAHYRIPILVDVDFGHTEPRLTLPVGVPARLDADAKTITLLAPATTARAGGTT